MEIRGKVCKEIKKPFTKKSKVLELLNFQPFNFELASAPVSCIFPCFRFQLIITLKFPLLMGELDVIFTLKIYFTYGATAEYPTTHLHVIE